MKLILTVFLFFLLPGIRAADIYVGAASTDITPTLPAAVDGQMSYALLQQLKRLSQRMLL